MKFGWFDSSGRDRLVELLSDGKRAVTPSSRRGRILALAVVAVIIVGAAVPVVASRLTGLPDDAAFKVGDTTVTKQQLQGRVKTIGALYGIRQPSDPKEANKFWRSAAKASAVGMVLNNAARDRGIVISEKVARDALTKMVTEQMGPSGRGTYVDLLKNAGASQNQVLDEIKLQQATAKLFQQVVDPAKISVTEADVRNYFKQRKNQMVVPEKRHLRNIVVTDRQQADRVLQQAAAGQDFAGLVQQNSLDQSTRSANGDLGFVARQQVEAGYGDVAFQAPQGSFFGPVKTRSGWNIGQVLDVQAKKPLRLEQVKDQLRDTIRSERALAKWRKWQADQIQAADVEYADRYQPADPAASPGGPGVPGQ
jgi:peptidyl-prolyl cis-trans isomerase C